MPVSEKAAGCGGHGKCRPDSAPAVAPTPQVQPVPLPAQARGCKGRSPLHEITLILPLPAGKSALRARAGGWGLQSKLKAGLAGDKQGKPPQRHRLDLPRGRGPSQTPKFLSPGPPSPWLPALLPIDKQNSLVVQVPLPAQARGCKGRSPLHEITLILPLPAGKSALRARAGGWGQKRKLKAR